MVLWGIIATGIVIIMLILFTAYRRQVKKICRQLAFLKEHETNLRLRSELPFQELNELIDNVNEVLEQSSKIRLESKKNEDYLKETITNLSHDIRTPLTSMDGYFQLLSGSDSKKERDYYISIIQKRIKSLKDMLEELFTYTKLQNENYEFELEKIDYSKCVYDTIFSFYDEFKQKEIQPEIEICQERIVIEGNEDATRRILQNILKNALEHGKEKFQISLSLQEENVVFVCANDVENAKEIDISQVFTRFYRADSARTRTSTGLGLSIAKGLVERMGGRIEAKLEEEIFEVRVVHRRAVNVNND